MINKPEKRQQRQAAALRLNLAKRKQQAASRAIAAKARLTSRSAAPKILPNNSQCD